MRKAVCVLLLAGVAASPGAAQDKPTADPVAVAQALGNSHPRPNCSSDDPNEVVVCGRSQQPYRIDPDVLAATRHAEALPPKPKLDATTAEGCTGPDCGGGNYVPLVGMALTALKAAELAADGDDWRDAFRTHPDGYQVYQQTKQTKSRISIGVAAGNTRR